MRHGLFREALCISLLAALPPLLTGCVSPSPGELGDETRWQPQLLYLNRSPHPSLYVEVGAVAGTEPTDAALEQLHQFLATYCDKPAGIQIVRDSVIPREEARGFSHQALAMRYLKGPPNSTNASPAFMYIQYWDSRLAVDPIAFSHGPIHKHLALARDFGWVNSVKPHAHLVPFPGMIFIDRWYMSGWLGRFEGLILEHEAGHLLGLTQDETHGLDNHCTNRTCLMWPKLLLLVPKALYSSQKTLQSNLCQKCEADLLRGKTGPPATNLLFLGPVLVRSEASYKVAVLPAQVKLFSGELTNLDTELFLKQMRESGESPYARTNFEFGRFNWLDLHDPKSDWPRQITNLESARADKFEMVRQASTNGLAVAQCVLGRVYYAGDGLEKNQGQAAEWFRRAAEAGNAEAQTYLASCYAQGSGVTQDKQAAFRWYLSAAEQGWAAAQVKVGRAYYDGEGTAKDFVRAYQWFLRAAQQGAAGGQSWTGYMRAKGEGVKRNPTAAVIWYRKAAEQGDAYAQNSLGECYSDGSGVRKNTVEAANWFRQAAEKGNSDARRNLAHSLAEGLGVPRDEIEAYKWLSLAAKAGDREADTDLRNLSNRLPPDQIKQGQERASAAALQSP